jgi:hypothetical protein
MFRRLMAWWRRLAWRRSIADIRSVTEFRTMDPFKREFRVVKSVSTQNHVIWESGIPRIGDRYSDGDGRQCESVQASLAKSGPDGCVWYDVVANYELAGEPRKSNGETTIEEANADPQQQLTLTATAKDGRTFEIIPTLQRDAHEIDMGTHSGRSNVGHYPDCG